MRALAYRFLFLSVAPFSLVVAVGCGGRTEGDFDFSGQEVTDSSLDDVSFDGSIDARDGGVDAIGVDVIRDGSSDVIRVDTRPDGIGVDVIGVDTRPDGVVDGGFDVIEIDTTPDVVGIDTTPDDIGFDVGFDSGIDGGPVDGGIHCGPTAECDPSTEDCCAMFGGSFSCVAKGTCGGFPISCSSSASCPTGDVCCLELGGPGGGGSASCTPAFCPGIQLCATSAECPPGTRCRRLFGGYRSCR